MKQRLFKITALALLIVGLASCGGSNNSEAIVGKWTLDAEKTEIVAQNGNKMDLVDLFVAEILDEFDDDDIDRKDIESFLSFFGVDDMDEFARSIFDSVSMSLRFNSNGTFKMRISTGLLFGDTEDGLYRVDGRKLYLYDDDGDDEEVLVISKLNDNNLVLKFQGDFAEEIFDVESDLKHMTLHFNRD